MPVSSRQGRTIKRVNPLPRGLCCIPCRERRVRCDGGKEPGCSSCIRKARWDGRNLETDLGCYYKDSPLSSLPFPPTCSDREEAVTAVATSSPSSPTASTSSLSSSTSSSARERNLDRTESKPTLASSSKSTSNKKPLSRRAARRPKGSVPPIVTPTGPLQKGLACITCKSRRVKCSGTKPACDSCVRNARWNGRCPDTEHGCVYRADLPRQTPYNPFETSSQVEKRNKPSNRRKASKDVDSRRSSSFISEGSEERESSPFHWATPIAEDRNTMESDELDIKPDLSEVYPAAVASVVEATSILPLSYLTPTLLDDPMLGTSPIATLSSSIFSTSPRLVPSLYASSTTDTCSTCPSPLLTSPSLSPLGTPFFNHELTLTPAVNNPCFNYPPLPYPSISTRFDDSRHLQQQAQKSHELDLDWDSFRLDEVQAEQQQQQQQQQQQRQKHELPRMDELSVGLFGKETLGRRVTMTPINETIIMSTGLEKEKEGVNFSLMDKGGEDESWKKELRTLMNDDVQKEWKLV